MAAPISKETKSLSINEKVAATMMVATTTTEVDALVSLVKCYCCGLMEECTQAYIARVQERYEGRWICGLCAEAVKEERLRSQDEMMKITIDEALKRHMKFHQQFRSSSPPNNTSEDLILVMKEILFRNLDSPRKKERGFNCRPLGRSQSCFSTMQGATTQPEE